MPSSPVFLRLHAFACLLTLVIMMMVTSAGAFVFTPTLSRRAAAAAGDKLNKRSNGGVGARGEVCMVSTMVPVAVSDSWLWRCHYGGGCRRICRKRELKEVLGQNIVPTLLSNGLSDLISNILFILNYVEFFHVIDVHVSRAEAEGFGFLRPYNRSLQRSPCVCFTHHRRQFKKELPRETYLRKL